MGKFDGSLAIPSYQRLQARARQQDADFQWTSLGTYDRWHGDNCSGAARKQSAAATTKPGSSPDMAIVPQPKCEPTNVGLIRTQWTIYSWPPE